MKKLLILFFFLGTVLFASESFLSLDEIEAYYQEGYFIKRGAIDPFQLAKMSTLFDTTIESVTETLSQNTYPISANVQKEYFDGSQVVFKKHGAQEISILRIVGCGSMEPQFLSLLRSNQMLKPSLLYWMPKPLNI